VHDAFAVEKGECECELGDPEAYLLLLQQPSFQVD
jgi:hypothetical protein